MPRTSLLAVLLAMLGTTAASGTEPESAAAPTATLHVELQVRDQDAPLRGKLWLQPAEDSDQEGIELVIKNQRSLSQELPAHSTWQVRLEVEGFWRPPSTIRVGEPGSVADYILPLWPAAWVVGQFTYEAGEFIWPENFQAQVASSRTPVTIPTAWTPCELKKDGAFRCHLPATTLDLTLKVPNLIPRHHWDLRLEQGKERSLGKLALRPGASIGFFVEVEGGAPIAEECRARLRPLRASSDKPQVARRRAEQLIYELPVPSDGFVQFEGVPPGTYVLEAEQPDYAIVQRSPVEVWTDSETLLTQPLTLYKPFDLDLTLNPASDLFGEPWSVHLTRHPSAGGILETVYEGKAGVDGRLVVPNQRPGRYFVIVSDALDNRMYSDPELQVQGAADAVRTLTLELLSVEGQLRLGDEPLSGILWFDGKHGANRVRMDALGEGKFEGYLPREGRWKVEVEAVADPALEAKVQVAVSPNRSGKAKLEIVLPDTEVFGQVIDESESPVSAARVMLDSPLGTVEQLSETDGSFRFRAAPEGLGQLRAEARTTRGRVTSLPVDLELLDGEPIGPLTLKLASTRTVTGRVVSAYGPVADAALRIETVPNGLSEGLPLTTDHTGRFEANISSQATALEVVVSAPGFGLQAFRQPLDGSELVLTVARGNEGSLQVVLPYTEDEARKRGEILVVWQDGVVIATPVLVRWAATNSVSWYQDGRLNLPNLAAANYRICVALPEQILAQVANPGAVYLPGCTEAQLAPGRTLQVQLDGEAK